MIYVCAIFVGLRGIAKVVFANSYEALKVRMLRN